jgi:hypothetical protein
MLEGLTPPNKESLCAVMVRAAELEPADLKILLEAIDDKRWSTLGLAETLTERGFIIGETTLRKHRVRKCACAR